MGSESLVSQMIVVLHRPRDVRNIGAVVRAMKNMGVQQLRLVQPAPFDWDDIGGIAHRSEDIRASASIHDTLDEALADAVLVVGTSARTRSGAPSRDDVRMVAAECVAQAHLGPVVLLFGPEDNGLDAAALDRCHLTVRLPTDPAYRSLNLAQAALLLLYEVRMAASAPPAPPAHVPATAAELETLFIALAALSDAAAFVKSGDGSVQMRTFRALLRRATPTTQEARLLTALLRELAAR